MDALGSYTVSTLVQESPVTVTIIRWGYSRLGKDESNGGGRIRSCTGWNRVIHAGKAWNCPLLLMWFPIASGTLTVACSFDGKDRRRNAIASRDYSTPAT